MAKRIQDTVTYDSFPTELGWCAAARTKRGICAFVLPVADADAAEREILQRHPEARQDAGAFPGLAKSVERYFEGWTTKFDAFELDLAAGTAFQQKVWEILRRVPYGQVRTYRWIGLEMGRPEAARAIGAAVGDNRIPLLVPCHRIIGADGALCGFSATGGLDLKARMLALEKVRVFGEGEKCRVLA